MVALRVTEGEFGLSVGDRSHREGLYGDKETELRVYQELQEHHHQLSPIKRWLSVGNHYLVLARQLLS